MQLIRRPFKGSWFYEWQIGPFVLQWQHTNNAPQPHESWNVRSFKSFNYFYDPFWRM